MDYKDKAKELVDKFKNKLKEDAEYLHFGWDGHSEIENWDELAKQCALICVEEIQKSNLNNNMIDIESLVELAKIKIYWEEVKQEIEKL